MGCRRWLEFEGGVGVVGRGESEGIVQVCYEDKNESKQLSNPRALPREQLARLVPLRT